MPLYARLAIASLLAALCGVLGGFIQEWAGPINWVGGFAAGAVMVWSPKEEET